mmetsp:Transcript_17228/g.42343  ORF Transcript_17228/g.42343 Transcript_17228/m.42343 type:complete len:112 (-) Transcript_17228:219-554(-)
MTKPLQLFKEMHRVLKPGGVAVMSFSNRCFPTKAVKVWLDSDDTGRMAIVANYFHHSAAWADICALDIGTLKGEGFKASPPGGAGGNPFQVLLSSFASIDPMFVVQARAKK